jgi:CheY-like chemotaxis protein
VIVADDSAAMRTLARFALSNQRGFRVVGEASDGAEAVAMADLHHPHCVVLDIEMPGMGGFEALAELRRRHPTLPVIMLSGYSGDSVVERATAGGAVACLDKSSQLGQLGTVIRRATHEAPPTPGALPLGSVSAGAACPAAPDASTEELRLLEYVISHDLSEPLRIMSGFVALLETRYADQLDARGKSFLAQITDASARMQSMVDDLLSYSRAGRVEVHLQRVSVVDLVAAVFAELGGVLAAQGVTSTAGDLPSVVADPALLARVVKQLVVNAFTFTTADAPAVHVSGRTIADGSVEITVEDNGIGIDQASRERVFDLFQRLNTREEYPGNGAGLAVCRRLLALQGARVHVNAAPGGGTAATITFDGPDASSTANPPPSPSAPPVPPAHEGDLA